MLLTLAAPAQDLSPVTVRPSWSVGGVTFLDFTGQGEVVTQPPSLTGGFAPKVERRDPGTGKVSGSALFREAGNEVGRVAFTPDLGTLAWLNRAGDVLTVQTGTGRRTSSLPGLRGTQALAFSPDGRTLAALNVYGYVQLWDVAAGQRRATLMLHSQPRNLTFHPTRPVLAVNEAGAPEGSVTLWNTGTGARLLTVPGLRGVLHPFKFAPDGSLLTDRGYGVAFLDLGLERLGQGDWGLIVRTLPTYTEPCPKGTGSKVCARGVRAASFSADGSRVLLNISRTPQNVSSALLYDTESGALLKVVDTPESSATLSPDGRTLLLSSYTGELQGAPLP